MRRGALLLILGLLWVATPSAQSKTISDDQLTELKGILQLYMQATNVLRTTLDDLLPTVRDLQTASADSKKRTDALQTGFDEYKGIVDTKLVPLAASLQAQVKTLQVIVIVLAVCTGATVIYAFSK